MKRFRIISGYPHALTFISVYNPIGYFINDSLSFSDESLIIDIGSFGEHNIEYDKIISFAKIGRYSVELTFDKNTFQKFGMFMNKILLETNSIYVSSCNIGSIILELEKHKINRLRDS